MEQLIQIVTQASLALFRDPDWLDDTDALLLIHLVAYLDRNPSPGKAEVLALKAIVQLAHSGCVAEARTLMAELAS